MKYSRACLVAILAIMAVVTTGSNYRLMEVLVGAGQWPAPNPLLAAPAGAATVSVGDLAVGSVISVGGMNYVKINSNNVLAAASNFACPDGQWIAGKYVRCYDQNWDGVFFDPNDIQVYGCQNPTGTLQTWNSCQNLATPAVGAYTQGPCLVDARDGKTYEIRKYADGKCWMVDNLAYGGDTALGGKDGCVAHPHSGGPFGANKSTIHDYEWNDDGTGSSDNFGQGYILRGTFGDGTYGSCAFAYDNSTYLAYEVFETDGYTRQTAEYDNYTDALVAASYDSNLVRPRGYHYDWVAATQNPTAYSGGIYDATQGLTSGICPNGWRLPTGSSTSAEWRQLFVAVGGAASGSGGANDESNAIARQYLLARWKAPISGYSAYNSSALSLMTTYSHWWSPAASGATSGPLLLLTGGAVSPEHSDPNRNHGFSVRCVKD